MRTSDQVHNALSTSQEFINGKLNAEQACDMLTKEVQQMQKYDWWKAVRNFEYQGSQSDSPASAKSVKASGYVSHPAEQIVINRSASDKDQNHNRQVVIEQTKDSGPLTVAVGHMEGNNFVVEAKKTVTASANPSEPSVSIKSTGSDDRGDGRKDLNHDEEAGTLAKLTRDVEKGEPGAVDKMRMELLKANEVYGDWRTDILKKYKALVDRPIIEQTPGELGVLELTPAYAPDKNAPKSDLFASPTDKLQSISPIAVGSFSEGYSSAFKELLGSAAQLDPKSVAEMIKDNGNGTCTVTFPGDPKRPITVAIPKDSGHHNQNDDYRGTWPQAVLNAYTEYVKQHVPEYKGLNNDKVWEKGHEQGAEQLAFKLLTNSTPDHDRMRWLAFGLDNRQKLGDKLFDNTQNGRPGLIYDRSSKEFRGILDYDKYSPVLYFTQGTMVNTRDIFELSPTLPNRYMLDFDDLYTRPKLEQKKK